MDDGLRPKTKRIETIIIGRAVLDAETGPAFPDNRLALAQLAGTLRRVDDPVAAGENLPSDQGRETVVLVSHTPAGIRAGRAAGVWVIGLALTGALADRTGERPTGDQLAVVLEETGLVMARAGAHFVVDSTADLSWIIREIDDRLAEGETV